MSLLSKLFLSYLIVIGLALVVLAVSTAFVAPVAFSGEVEAMRMRGVGMMWQGQGQGPHNEPPPEQGPTMMTGWLTEVEDELNTNFRRSVNSALLLAGAGAIAAAAIASWVVTRRIVRPIQEMSKASEHIAEGHYSERLTVYDDDELGELTQNFNRMAEALAQTEAMRQQLIADVSHELKTPLASIKGYMEGLQDGVIEASPETYQLVHREADRLQRLVHDLQELSRAEASQLQLELEACDANELATSAAQWLRPQFDDRQITLEVVPLAEPVQVRADFDRARQVLLNLLGNAMQYTPEGGQVTLRMQPEGDMLRFSVSDTGSGLTAEDLKLIFQRFYRVDKSRARSSGGSGIGLTIARHIAEAHGGRLLAESPGAGQGSTFHFSLPLV